MADTAQEIKLTGKQKKFADAYVICLNATKAAQLAGYAGDYATLSVVGYENLRKPNIRAYIDELFTAQNLSEEEIIGRLAGHARGDIGEILDPTTMTVDLRLAQDKGLTHLIKEIEQVTTISDDRETHIFKVKLHDSQSALVHLGRAKALFTDKQKIEGGLTLSWKDAVEQAKKDGHESSPSTD